MIARDPLVLGADPFFMAFIAGVEAELSAAARRCCCRSSVTTAPARPTATATSRAPSASTASSSPTCGSTTRGSRCARSSGLQAVTLNRPDVPSPFPAVCQDDGPGVAAAVRHLAELGHERIAYVAGRQDFLHGSAPARGLVRRRWPSSASPSDLVQTTDFTAAAGRRAPPARC